MSEYNKIEPYNPNKRWFLCLLTTSDGTLRQPIKFDETSVSYGHPGDLLGIEGNTKLWSNGMSSGGFGNVFRFHDESIRHKIADLELRMTASGYVGYSQLVNANIWRWRGGYMRAMCAKQQGLDMKAWGDSRFLLNWTADTVAGKINMRQIKLNELDPSMVEVPCNADCSSSVLSNILIATNLWFHCGYTYNGVYARWMDAIPQKHYGCKGGGSQVSKFFRKCMVPGGETDVIYDSLGYTFNTTAKCDWISYEDYDVLDCPFYELTDELKDPTFEWGTFSTVYSDSLYTEKDPYDESITGWAPPTYGGRNVRVWHIGFNPANPNRQVNYRYRVLTHWEKGKSTIGLKDKNNNYIRWNLYVYGYTMNEDGPEKKWLREDISETEAKEQLLYDLMRTAGSYKWKYHSVMSHFVVAQDNEQLLEGVYDDDGEFTAYEDMNGDKPWVSAIKVKQWCRSEPDVKPLSDSTTMINDEPYVKRFSNFEEVNWADEKGLKSVSGIELSEYPRVSALRYYANNDWNLWNDRNTWLDNDSNWRTTLQTNDPDLKYGQYETWTLDNSTYGKYDVYGKGTGYRYNWTSKSRLTKIFNKRVKQYINVKPKGRQSDMTFPVKATFTNEHNIYCCKCTDASLANPIWVYYTANGPGASSTLMYNYVWVHTGNELHPEDDLFPYFTVQACEIDKTTLAFTYNGINYTLLRGSDNCIRYYYYIYTRGLWYTQWNRFLTGGGRQFVVETTKKFAISDSEQFEPEGTEEDPTSEDFYFWLKLDGTPEEGVWVETPSPFGDQETDEEDEEAEVVASSIAPVLEYDTYLWAGDIITTRSGIQGTVQGGHWVSYA